MFNIHITRNIALFLAGVMLIGFASLGLSISHFMVAREKVKLLELNVLFEIEKMSTIASVWGKCECTCPKPKASNSKSTM